MSPLMQDPIWKELKFYVEVQPYAPDGGHKRPRIRIEFRPMPEALLTQALDVKVPCVACGDPIHPVRKRNGKNERADTGHFYYAGTCPLDQNLGCARGKKAREDYEEYRKVFRPDLM